MFDILFGWRKASKCKKLIKRVQCRLKLLKNKRFSIVRHIREDVAQLLRIGHEEIAFNRVEQLYKDECIMSLYELLDHFCEFIIIHLSYIRKHKDCPNDINEAVSSLIFASARCGDLPELLTIRKLFGERYGQQFALAAVELLPGNLVNHQIKEKLSVIKTVPDDVKLRLVVEIFRECCLLSGPLALEFSSEWHQQQFAAQERFEDHRMQDSDFKDIEVEAVYFDSPPKSTKSLTEDCFSLHDIGIENDISSASTDSIVLQSSSQKVVKAEISVQQKGSPPDKFTVSGLGDAAASSSEGSSQFPDQESVVYLDDIEEFQSPIKKDGNSQDQDQDQRLFVFKSPVLVKKVEKVENIMAAGSRRSRKSEKTVRNRLRKRPLSKEEPSINDADFAVYYGFSCCPNQKSRISHQRKHQKRIQTENGQEAYYRRKSGCSCNSVDECSLQHPCYFGTNDNPKPRRDHENGGLNCDLQPEKPTKKTEIETERLDFLGSTASLCSKVPATSPVTKNNTKSPYLRAMTMPDQKQKGPKDDRADNILRSNSFPLPNHLNHVHPKLPDYDELEAKFNALKKAHLSKQHL